jgi:hypothetical protein
MEKLTVNSMFQFFKITHFCLKFPKGMYVYRNIMDGLTQIPKGFYVIVDIFTYNPFGIWEKCPISSYKHTFPSGICIKLYRYKKLEHRV